MTREELVLYVSRFGDFASWKTTRQIDYLSYYLLGLDGTQSVTVVDLENCLVLLDLRPYSRLAVYLSEETKKKGGRYVKHASGYRLERAAFDEIKAVVDS